MKGYILITVSSDTEGTRITREILTPAEFSTYLRARQSDPSPADFFVKPIELAPGSLIRGERGVVA